LATCIAAVPLVLFGGTVTSLRAGMAENGWINPDGYFLWAYPVDKRFQNIGVFVEHHHRELGSLVGLLAISAALAAWRKESRPLARVLPLFALLAVCVQGLIGGLRVLENSPDLAFLHGAFGQSVFAFLAATSLYLSPRWRAATPSACKTAAGLQHTTSVGVALVFAQVTIGAWLRHSKADLALALHVILAAGVLGAVVVIGRQMSAAVEQTPRGGSDRRILIGVKRRLHSLVGVQLLLGGLATFWIYEVSQGPQAPVSTGEAVFATLHVAVGALLLAQTVAAAMWARRIVCTQAQSELAGLEGAR
jgi:cytochrome c oxidase assembly protein subunit 15